jgi:hypothetical protein
MAKEFFPDAGVIGFIYNQCRGTGVCTSMFLF